MHRTFDLQKRAPSDRVSGTLSLTVEPVDSAHLDPDSMDAAHSDVLTELSTQTSVISQMSVTSHDGSCASSDDERSPLIIQQSFPDGAGGVATESDIIPIVMVTDGNAVRATEVVHTRGSDNSAHPSQEMGPEDQENGHSPTALERQLSEPLLPSAVREVLYGSRLRLGEGLIRHHSVTQHNERRSRAVSPTPSPIESPATPLTSPKGRVQDDNSLLTDTLPPSES